MIINVYLCCARRALSRRKGNFDATEKGISISSSRQDIARCRGAGKRFAGIFYATFPRFMLVMAEKARQMGAA